MVQFVLAGIASYSLRYRNLIAALALNPQAFFPVSTAVHRVLSEGGLLIVAAISGADDLISTLTRQTALPAYSLSPPSTLAPEPPSTSKPVSPTPNASGNLNESKIAMPAHFKGSSSSNGVVVGVSVVGALIGVVLVSIPVAYVVLRARRRRNLENSQLEQLDAVEEVMEAPAEKLDIPTDVEVISEAELPTSQGRIACLPTEVETDTKEEIQVELEDLEANGSIFTKPTATIVEVVEAPE